MTTMTTLNDEQTSLMRSLYHDAPLVPPLDSVQLDRAIEQLSELGFLAYIEHARLVLTHAGLGYCGMHFDAPPPPRRAA